MTAVMGCDPSLAGFAFSVAAEGLHGALHIHEHIIKTKPSGDDVRARCERYRSIVQPTVAAVHAHVVSLVVIEGYSFGSAGGKVSGHAHDRAELGGVLRNQLVDYCRVVEVAPTTLKKFATGKGNADKAEVVSALSRRYGRTFKSDDAADAFALMQIGLCLTGDFDPETRAQQEVIAMLCGKPLPKLTKKQRDAIAQGSLLA